MFVREREEREREDVHPYGAVHSTHYLVLASFATKNTCTIAVLAAAVFVFFAASAVVIVVFVAVVVVVVVFVVVASATATATGIVEFVGVSVGVDVAIPGRVLGGFSACTIAIALALHNDDAVNSKPVGVHAGGVVVQVNLCMQQAIESTILFARRSPRRQPTTHSA